MTYSTDALPNVPPNLIYRGENDRLSENNPPNTKKQTPVGFCKKTVNNDIFLKILGTIFLAVLTNLALDEITNEFIVKKFNVCPSYSFFKVFFLNEKRND